MRMFRGVSDILLAIREINSRGLARGVESIRNALRLRIDLRSAAELDSQVGVDTSGYVLLSEVESKGMRIENCSEYLGAPISIVERVLSRLPRDVSEYVFVDFGSGKGRVLFIAARKRFKRIVGVEFLQEFHQAAKNNLQAYKDRRQSCFDIESVCLDARDFELPQEKCVLFFYRPFSGPVLTQVLQRIEASYRAAPRKMYLIYLSPFAENPSETLAFMKDVPLPRTLMSYIVPDPVKFHLAESLEEGT